MFFVKACARDSAELQVRKILILAIDDDVKAFILSTFHDTLLIAGTIQ